MKALILAAGYATRLYPYTKNFPKPLLEVNQKPIIEYLIEKLEKLPGLSEILVVTNGRFFPFFEKWKKTVDCRKKIRIINDHTRTSRDRLGAIGDMNFVFGKLGFKDDYLVIGGDNFFKESLVKFAGSARKSPGAVTIGVCDIKKISEARNFGVVSLDKNRRIIDFWEKPAQPKSSLVAMCLYYFPGSQVGFIREYLSDPANESDAAGAYIGWLTRNKIVKAVVFKNHWVDIGSVQAYKKANKITKTKGAKAK
jgi:glucose-1-phosphate thymidylyltransferase